MITEKALREAAFWEESICTNCGDTGGEPLFLCYQCDKQVVLGAKLILAIFEQVEPAEEEGS